MEFLTHTVFPLFRVSSPRLLCPTICLLQVCRLSQISVNDKLVVSICLFGPCNDFRPFFFILSMFLSSLFCLRMPNEEQSSLSTDRDDSVNV